MRFMWANDDDVRRNQYVKHHPRPTTLMALELERTCPECGSETFYRAASTTVHLGEKVKWHCTDCEYGFVQIDGIDSSTA